MSMSRRLRGQKPERRCGTRRSPKRAGRGKRPRISCSTSGRWLKRGRIVMNIETTPMTPDTTATAIISSVALESGSLNELPQALFGLLDYVVIGIDRVELTQRAYRKGLSPVWEQGEHPHEGRLILHYHDRRWSLLCSLTPVRVH